MYILKVLIEHSVFSISRGFFYLSNELVEVGCRVIVPLGYQKEVTGFVNNYQEVNSTYEELCDEYGLKFQFIKEVIDESPIINKELYDLANELSKRYFHPLIGVLQTMLPPSLKPSHSSLNAPKIKYDIYYKKIKEVDETLNSNERKVLSHFNNDNLILKKDINDKTKSFISLLNKGYILKETHEVNRYKINQVFDYENEITLTNEQEVAFNEIINGNDQVYLLKGVTGSGKTEVYIKLIEHYIKKNKSALILVPEIALTPLMISRLKSYFDDEIAVLHSSLSASQKYDEYRKIRDNKSKIVVGTRSSIFAPLSNIGIIIIDEENDESYKEEDHGVLYNAKDVALIRAKTHNAKVVFGSATPSIEMMAKAKNNKIKLLTLNHRYNDVSLPEVTLVDRTNFENFTKESHIFSKPLIKEIKETLSRGEQIILFVNSRGYARSMKCIECGKVMKCPTCGLPLHYHKEKGVLYCHHCEFKMPVPHVCPSCGSKYLSLNNFGIEKVEEDFKKLFNVDYLVLDSDRTPKSLQIERILEDFSSKKAQVLIGTQIVCKGHDFPNVSLVACLDADIMLNFPNYRSKEITFSMLTQFIGRAGRKDKVGKAIIQTSYPNDYAINLASKQDYEAFYEKEINERKRLNNPPFFNILAIGIESKNESTLKAQSLKIKNYFLTQDLKNSVITGPSLFIKNGPYFHANIFIKYKRYTDVQIAVEDLIDLYRENQKIRIKFNLNPFMS